MAGEPGVDYPEQRAAIDINVAGRVDLPTSFVERVDGRDLVVTVGQDRAQRRVRLDPGERLELIWRGPEEMRSVSAELLDVTSGGAPTWQVRLVGPAGRGQRRSAVRTPISFPVELRAGERAVPGAGVDLSEGASAASSARRRPLVPTATTRREPRATPSRSGTSSPRR